MSESTNLVSNQRLSGSYSKLDEEDLRSQIRSSVGYQHYLEQNDIQDLNQKINDDDNKDNKWIRLVVVLGTIIIVIIVIVLFVIKIFNK